MKQALGFRLLPQTETPPQITRHAPRLLCRPLVGAQREVNIARLSIRSTVTRRRGVRRTVK
jgi:hypothetical protein